MKSITFKIIIFYLAIFSSSFGYAQKWLCHETASMRYGSKIMTCGVGEAKSEAQARSKALENATKEFNQLCEQDLTCKDFKTRVEPKRNSCSFTNKKYKCYRGIEYEITTVKKDKVDLAKVEDELEKKKKEYELAKERYEKKKEIEKIDKKIQDQDFSGGVGGWNNFFHLGLQIGLSSGIGTDFSISSFSSGFLFRYIPKQRWGLQLKRYNLNLSSNDSSQLDSDVLDEIMPMQYSASGNINIVSLIYYFTNLELNNPSTGFLGFGKGKIQNKYSYTYLDETSNQIKSFDGNVSSDVNYFTIGYTTTAAFCKQGEVGYEFGIDFYNITQENIHYLDSVLDIYLGFIWGY